MSVSSTFISFWDLTVVWLCCLPEPDDEGRAEPEVKGLLSLPPPLKPLFRCMSNRLVRLDLDSPPSSPASSPSSSWMWQVVGLHSMLHLSDLHTSHSGSVIHPGTMTYISLHYPTLYQVQAQNMSLFPTTLSWSTSALVSPLPLRSTVPAPHWVFPSMWSTQLTRVLWGHSRKTVREWGESARPRWWNRDEEKSLAEG